MSETGRQARRGPTAAKKEGGKGDSGSSLLNIIFVIAMSIESQVVIDVSPAC